MQPIKAGVIYFVGVFALGFLFGGIRLMLLQPLMGETIAVAVEVPIMLVLAWMLCARAINMSKISTSWTDRLTMGLVALSLLLLAEFGLSIAMFGNQLVDYLESYTTLPGLIGLGGQILFGLFPLIQSLSNPA